MKKLLVLSLILLVGVTGFAKTNYFEDVYIDDELTVAGTTTFADLDIVGDLGLTGSAAFDGTTMLFDGSTSARLVSAGFTSLEAAANRIGVSSTIYLSIATTAVTGVTAITHTGSAPTVTWTANSFDFVGAMALDAVTLSDVLTFSDAATIDNTAADTLTITETNVDVAGALNATAASAIGVEISGANTSHAVSISAAQTGSGFHVGDTWGYSTGFDTAAINIGGDSTIAFGSTTDNLVLARYDISAQIGVADKYFIGEYKTYATSGEGAGTVLQRGIWMGDYCGLTIAHNTTDAYATRGRTSITDTIEGNQFIGVMGQINISGAATLEDTGGAYGVYGSVTSDTSGACNRNVAAGLFTMRSNTIDLVGTQSCVVADMGGAGYADYGFTANVGNNNTTAGMRINTTDSAVLPIGIQLAATSGSITKQIEFTSGAGIYTGTADPNGTLSAEDGSLYIRTGTTNSSTILYVCTGTTSWTAITP